MATSREDYKNSKGEVIAPDVEVETLDAVPVTAKSVFGEYNKNAEAAFANLQAAESAGHVTKKTVTVEFVQKDGDKITKVFRQDVTQYVAKNKAGALTLPAIEGDESAMWNAVSDFAFRNAKQGVYVRLRNIAAGPEKAIEKINKLLGNLTPEQREKALRELGLA